MTKHKLLVSQLAALATSWKEQAQSLRECTGPEADAPHNVSGEYQRARDFEECAAAVEGLALSVKPAP